MTNRRLHASRAASSESGQILIAVALLSVVLIGFLGFALDGGYLYLVRRRAQTAADAGAIAGALHLWQGSGDVNTAVRRDAALNGFPGVNEVIPNHPPVEAALPFRNPNYVEAIIARPHDPFFMDLLGFGTTTIRARAVAGPVNSPSVRPTLVE
jgi:hypothetical protein